MKVIKLLSDQCPVTPETIAVYAVANNNYIRISVFQPNTPIDPELEKDRILSGDIKEQFINYLKSQQYNYNIESGYLNKLIDLTEVSSVFSTDYAGKTFAYLGSSVLQYTDIERRQDYSAYTMGLNGYTMTLTPWQSLFPNTYLNKNLLNKQMVSTGTRLLATLYAPSRADELTSNENTLVLDRHVFFENISDTEHEYVEENVQNGVNNNPKAYLPLATVSGPVAMLPDSEGEFTVTLRKTQYDDESHTYLPTGEIFDKELKIILDSSAGYLPIKKLTTVNGVCTFKLFTTHVPVGTEIDLKINTDNYTRIGSTTIMISAE
jgi:hypothetical protein